MYSILRYIFYSEAVDRELIETNLAIQCRDCGSFENSQRYKYFWMCDCKVLDPTYAYQS